MAGGVKAQARDVYGSDKAKFSRKSLLLSRTIVEKDGYVSTGVLTHIDGDMMEIELSEFKNFELGDPVDLTVYSPVGIHRLHSSVIAKASGALAFLFPERSLAGLEERREAPRIDVIVKGELRYKQSRSVMAKEGLVTVEAEEEFDLITRNISDSGVAFQVAFGPKLAVGDCIDVTLEFGSPFHCRLEIMRKVENAQSEGYGARFLELNEQERRALRAFLIREQVEAYFRKKQAKKDSE